MDVAGASFLPPVVAVLLADTKGLKAGMAEARGEMAATGNSFRTLGAVGRTTVLALGAAAVAVGAYSVHAAMNFDAAMERVHTQAGASQAEVNKLSNAVLALAGPTAQAPNALALSLYHIESAGFRGAQALGMVTAAAKLATIGNADLGSTTQAMIATIASGIPGVHGINDAVALLNATVGTGDMTMQQLADAMATGILPAGRVAGLTFEDVAAAIATITDNASPAVVAATRLRMTFAMMNGPSGAAVKALKKIGMTSTELARDMRGKDGLMVAMADLYKHLSKLKGGVTGVAAASTMTHAFGGGRSSGSVETLLVEMDRLHAKYAALGTVQSRAKQLQESWAATMQTFKYKVDSLKASLEAVAIRIGNFLIPIIEKVVTWLIDAGKWVASHKAAWMGLAAVLGTVVVAGLISIAGALGAIVIESLPLAAVVVAIAALADGAVYAYQHFKRFHDIVDMVGRAIKAAAGWLMQHKQLLIAVAVAVGMVVAPWYTVIAVLVAAYVKFAWFRDVVSAVIHAVGDAFEWMRGIFDKVVNWIKSILGPFIGWWQAHWSQIRTVLQSVWAAIVMVVKVAWALISNYLSVALSVLGTVFRVAWDIISGVVKVAWDIISTIVKVAWDFLSGIIRVGFDTMRMIFETALALLTGHWSQAWHDVTSGFSRIFGTIVDAAANILSNLKQGFLNGVKDFGSLLWNAGKDLIMGLIHGIGSMASNAVNAVKNVGKSIIGGIKGILHINSPSLVMKKIGQGVNEGLAWGITDSSQIVTNAMRVTADRAIAASLKAYSAAQKKLSAAAVKLQKDSLSGDNTLDAASLRVSKTDATWDARIKAALEKYQDDLAYRSKRGKGKSEKELAADRAQIVKDELAERKSLALAELAYAKDLKTISARIAKDKAAVATDAARVAALRPLYGLEAKGVTASVGGLFGQVGGNVNPLATLGALNASSAAGVRSGTGLVPGGGTRVLVPTRVELDGHVIWETVQEHILEYANRNNTNGLTPVGR